MCFDLAQLPLTDVQRIKAAVSSGRSKQYQPTGTYNVNPLYWVSKCGFGTQWIVNWWWNQKMKICESLQQNLNSWKTDKILSLHLFKPLKKDFLDFVWEIKFQCMNVLTVIRRNFKNILFWISWEVIIYPFLLFSLYFLDHLPFL